MTAVTDQDHTDQDHTERAGDAVPEEAVAGGSAGAGGAGGEEGHARVEAGDGHEEDGREGAGSGVGAGDGDGDAGVAVSDGHARVEDGPTGAEQGSGRAQAEKGSGRARAGARAGREGDEPGRARARRGQAGEASGRGRRDGAAEGAAEGADEPGHGRRDRRRGREEGRRGREDGGPWREEGRAGPEDGTHAREEGRRGREEGRRGREDGGPERDEERAGRDDGSPARDERRRGRTAGGRVGTEADGGSTGAGDAWVAVDGDSGGAWDDGLIARRVSAESEQAAVVEARGHNAPPAAPLAYDGPLRSRLDALRELIGLSRTRLDSRTLAEAGQVLDEAAARRRLSGQHTVVAIAGATGSGKSQLFNALAGVTISETGVRRPTTAAPIACSWSDGSASLIERLGIPPRLRRRPLQSAESEAQLRGLVLVDLPDHDSAAVQHREHVDRILALVDAVIWVVDPEKYADAILHERYLRPMAGHAEVMFIVLNQIDRLPGEAAEQVLDDLRRLLDEDGIALGEYGEPGATVLALSALTGDGIGELRESLGQFVAERGAPARRIAADVDAAAWRLRPVYATGRRTGLSEDARDDFAARLADAVGATAAGEAAERAWLRNANRACGTPWLRLWRWYQDRREPPTGRLPLRAPADEEATARQQVEQAVRTLADRASAGLPAPWAQAVREAAVRGSQGLSEALDELTARAGLPPGRPPRPGWWPAAVLAQASMTLLQIVGGAWLVGQIVGVMAPNLGVPVLLMVLGIIGGPLVEWSCRMAARGPARRYGVEAERRLREAAAGCGRARVLDPVAAELLRYREVREQYGRVVGVG
ncbi:YfjP family GTPase [Streptomyces griseorubiginosus]|uniref:YfjP family GTPase n=1 Tax=Streptomyces griseorubiginosus TaxID=67304 RepID=UPI0034186E3F